MADVAPINQTESLANPFALGNGVPPPFQAGRDGVLVEFERFLGDAHPVHANWTLTEIRLALPDVQNVDQVVARLLEAVRPAGRAAGTIRVLLFRTYLQRRADLTHRSQAR